MKAIVQRKVGNFEIEEIEDCILKENEILIRIYRSGICTNDIRDYTGENSYSYPRIGGHEYCGEIAEMGFAVNKDIFSLGDHVASYIIPYCGECYYCHRGDTNLCKEWSTSEIFYNNDGFSGFKGFAEYIAVDAKDVYKYPKNISYDVSVFTEPLGCVINSINQCNNLRIGDNVMVIGGGTMGMLHVMMLNKLGFDVTLSEINEDRLTDGISFGANHVLNPKEIGYDNKIKELTNGNGMNAIFNTTAIPKIAESLIKFCASNGTIVMFSSMHPNEPILLDVGYIHTTQIKVTGANSPSLKSFAEAVEVLSKSIIDPTPLLSKKILFTEAEEGIKLAQSPTTYKVVYKMCE